MTGLAARRVAPFGHPGITACVQLPQAYRSLPRPSSPLDAKASTMRLIAFDLIVLSVPASPAMGPASTMVFGFLTPSSGHHAGDRHIHPSIVKERKHRCGVLGAECGRHGRTFVRAAEAGDYSSLQKGGDPAAGSPTATLLRLRPSH